MYIPSITYGFESISSNQIDNLLHVIFKFENHRTFLVYAPSDPQLDLISLELTRFLRKYERIKESRMVVEGAGKIQKKISESIEDNYISSCFRKISELIDSEDEILDDAESICFMSIKSLEIVANLISLH